MSRSPIVSVLLLATALLGGRFAPLAQQPLLPIPDRLIVLNFDDGTKTDITTVAPVLKRYGFGATFYVTDPNTTSRIAAIKSKGGSLSWDDIQKLNEKGFEIGNHTANHPDVRTLTPAQFTDELDGVEQGLKRIGVPAPQTFAYPGWKFSLESARVLLRKGYLFARRGVSPEFPDGGEGARGSVYDPKKDNPLLIPTTGYAGPKWGLKDLAWAIDQAQDGKIAVIVFHGVPYPGAPWVSTDPKVFENYMNYLHTRGCKVIATRDLIKYVAPANASHIPLTEPQGAYK